jgi:hypothetical protein
LNPIGNLKKDPIKTNEKLNIKTWSIHSWLIFYRYGWAKNIRIQ